MIILDVMKNQKKEKMILDPKSTCITYQDHFYMVAGYISDYKLTLEQDLTDKSGNKILTSNDFKENYGYVDSLGNVYIYRSEPNKGELIPWFTTKVTTNGDVKLIFTSHVSRTTKSVFNVNRIVNINPKIILKNTKNTDEFYDKDMIDELMSAGSAYRPVINENDDFLKMVTKMCLISSDTDANTFKKYAEKPWQISNLIQGLSKETKLSPLFFSEWMGYGGWKFTLRVENERGCINPLPYPVEYSSDRNTVYLVGKKEENSDEGKGIIVASPHKHND